MAIRYDFSGRVALVTGGSSGLGEAIALGFAEAGAQVVITGRNQTRLDAVRAAVATHGNRALAIKADLRRRDEIRESVRKTLDAFGKIDILVNSAGIFQTAPVLETADELWDEVLAVNLSGTFLYCREVAKSMVKASYGRIVNIASVDALTAVPGEVAYCVSKSGVVALTRVFAVELAKSGVHVNAVAPCDFDTPMVAEYLSQPGNLEATLSAVPAGRIGKPSELVPAVLYLASEEASMTVGHTLVVDGGRTII